MGERESRDVVFYEGTAPALPTSDQGEVQVPIQTQPVFAPPSFCAAGLREVHWRVVTEMCHWVVPIRGGGPNAKRVGKSIMPTCRFLQSLSCQRMDPSKYKTLSLIRFL